jgi:hypothetical protein
MAPPELASMFDTSKNYSKYDNLLVNVGLWLGLELGLRLGLGLGLG